MSTKTLSEDRGELQRDSTTFQEAAGKATWGGIDGNIVDQADLQAALEIAELCKGQTPVNRTASRSAGITYTNTSGRSLVFKLSCGTSNLTATKVTVDGVDVLSDLSYTATPYTVCMTVIVPAGSTYRVNYIQSTYLWVEYE